MEAIFLINGVYVCMDKELDSDRIEEEQTLIISNYGSRVLFGGRVVVDFDGDSCHFYIDGIELLNYDKYYPNISRYFKYGTIAAFLNQIEQLGVDTFLSNYKEAVKSFKDEVSALSCQLEADLQVDEDEGKRKMLTNLRYIMDRLIGLLFVLSIKMNAGLDNQTYISAYDECENIISQYIND